MLRPLSIIVALCASPVLAQTTAPDATTDPVTAPSAPNVLTDIAPIHSLTAAVMEGVAIPSLLMQPGVDVHDLALRPSDAAMLTDADVIVWVGSDLSPWLTAPLETLAPSAATLTLSEVPGWTPQTTADGTTDPHAWLDPEVAIFWLRAIRDTLIATDPDNAVRYTDNTDTMIARLIALDATLKTQLADVPSGSFIAPHDAFGYFEARFGVASGGTISDAHDYAPGPAHVQELRDTLGDGTISCVLSETGGATDYAQILTEGTQARTAQIDDVGISLTPGPLLYEQLLTQIADTLTTCISGVKDGMSN